MQFYSHFFHWTHFNQSGEMIYHFDFFLRIFNQTPVHHFWFYQTSFPLTYFMERKPARDIVKWKIVFPISFIIFSQLLESYRVIVTSLLFISLFIIRSAFPHSSFHLHFGILPCRHFPLHHRIRMTGLTQRSEKSKRQKRQKSKMPRTPQLWFEPIFWRLHLLLFGLLIIVYDWNLWFDQTEKIKILVFSCPTYVLLLTAWIFSLLSFSDEVLFFPFSSADLCSTFGYHLYKW